MARRRRPLQLLLGRCAAFPQEVYRTPDDVCPRGASEDTLAALSNATVTNMSRRRIPPPAAIAIAAPNDSVASPPIVAAAIPPTVTFPAVCPHTATIASAAASRAHTPSTTP